MQGASCLFLKKVESFCTVFTLLESVIFFVLDKLTFSTKIVVAFPSLVVAFPSLVASFPTKVDFRRILLTVKRI